MLINQFLGNNEIKNRLFSLLSRQSGFNEKDNNNGNGRFPHAILLIGEDGIGKKTFARLIAKGILCKNMHTQIEENKENKLNKENELKLPPAHSFINSINSINSINPTHLSYFPCEKCISCKKIENDTCPDVITVSGEGKTGSITVEKIRSVVSDSSIMPNENEKKIYIIPNAENMTIQGQNAFLKTLEEPNDYSIFILTATHKSKLLETIISRVTPFSLSPVNFEDFSFYFSNKNIPQSFKQKDKIETLFEESQGNIGKAISMLPNFSDEENVNSIKDENSDFDKIDNNEFSDFEKIEKYSSSFLTSIINKNEYESLKTFASLKGNKKLFLDVLTNLVLTLGDALTYSIDKKSILFKNKIPLLKKISGNLTKQQIMCMIDVLNSCYNNSKRNINENLNLTLICSECSEIFSV